MRLLLLLLLQQPMAPPRPQTRPTAARRPCWLSLSKVEQRDRPWTDVWTLDVEVGRETWHNSKRQETRTFYLKLTPRLAPGLFRSHPNFTGGPEFRVDQILGQHVKSFLCTFMLAFIGGAIAPAVGKAITTVATMLTETEGDKKLRLANERKAEKGQDGRG